MLISLPDNLDIKARRKQLKITQKELGEVVGQTQSQICQFENGRNPFYSWKYYKSIVDFLWSPEAEKKLFSIINKPSKYYSEED